MNADDRLREMDGAYDTVPEERDLRAEGLYLLNRAPTYPNQYVVGDGWLNFTATPRSSTLRMVFFCQAENTLGKVRSRKMVIHQGHSQSELRHDVDRSDLCDIAGVLCSVWGAGCHDGRSENV
ncbi:unnamed protein product [Schistocephalus solidus]|uniref:Uncharacterized protein n=1 Tax=Schistocephalus solidus TaxID=70667 RepID=A0A3P7DFU1_SCHSO|nr:unnamed protein product [Schistocephalus solidus]